MEKLEVKVLAELMEYENVSYGIYEMYCKANNKTKELLVMDEDGINTLFDTPFDAVRTMYDNSITICSYSYIYRDNNDKFCACDFIEECSLVNMMDIAKWIIESEEVNEDLYELLSKLDIPFHMCDKLYKGGDNEFVYQFAEWVDTELGLVKFLKSDWMELINNFKVV